MKTYIAILRGINVGGMRIIKMDALKKLFENLGYNNVQTYIQSGNVIFTIKKSSEEKLATIISIEINKIFGFDVQVIVKDAEELKQIMLQNIFVNDIKKDAKYFHITFLSAIPTKENIEVIAKQNFGEEDFVVIEKSVYLYCPNGYGKTKLNNIFFENKLKVTATTRNWKTCIALLKLATGEIEGTVHKIYTTNSQTDLYSPCVST